MIKITNDGKWTLGGESTAIGRMGDINVNVITLVVDRFTADETDLKDGIAILSIINPESNYINPVYLTQEGYDDDTITYTWLVGAEACAIAGTLSVALAVTITDTDGTVTDRFKSLVQKFVVEASNEMPADSGDVDYDDVVAAAIKLIGAATAYDTPEGYGAVGDGVADDTEAVKECMASSALHKVLTKTYKITSPITDIPADSVIDGGGIIKASTSAFVLDGAKRINMSNLTIGYADYGIHLTSTNNWGAYCNFRNLFLDGSEESSVGVLIERTTNFLNEMRFEDVAVFGGNAGFYIKNPDASVECDGHRFLHCSAEEVTTGFILQDSSADSFEFCRLEESGITTIDKCNQLVVMTSRMFENLADLSDGTNGIIVGQIRGGEVYAETFGGYARIVKGKIIPCEEWLNANSHPANTDVTYPLDGVVCNHFHKYPSTETTLTLDSGYYGGDGLVNDLYIYLPSYAGKITISNGDVTAEVSPSTTDVVVHLHYMSISGTGHWITMSTVSV